MGSLNSVSGMLHLLYSSTTLQPPHLDIAWPTWLGVPSSNAMFFFSLFVYYVSVSGITYDIINSPPAFGVEADGFGNTRPVAILKWQLNQQYIVEGFTAGFMMLLTSSGLMILDQSNHITSTRMGKMLMVGLGIAFSLVGPFATYTFFKIKWPNYLEDMFLIESR